MLTKTVDGAYHEVYVEGDPATFKGGDPARTVVTGIRLPKHSDLEFCEAYLYLDAIVGTPLVPDPVLGIEPDPTGQGLPFVKVTFQNQGLLPTDTATFTLDVRLNHSVNK